ncbi:hypothetical protein PoB_005650600 [Plakobranchus ocellatus]|uniref:RING-type domain-containing protein n=1 Tax=Plakobranchus ocellatus TaxID=259542 RepID=A0AAV4CF50_9GAST|nr:hypothetical protein PoB_005650600 [Plakobranchus ocellatus]
MPLLSSPSLLSPGLKRLSYPFSAGRTQRSNDKFIWPGLGFEPRTSGLVANCPTRAPIKRAFEKKKKRAHICILYFFKTIHHQIVHYGKDGQDKAELVKKLVTDRAELLRISSGERKPNLKIARSAIQEGHLEGAILICDQAIQFDPFNSQHYHCRAQINIQMSNFLNALIDCWRSIVLDQRNSAKSCYLAARCYLEFSNLDRAAEMNELAMDFCVDADQKELIQEQAAKIHKEKQELRVSRRRGRSVSEVDNLEEEKVTVVFAKLQCDGSKLYESRKFGAAMDKFHAALDMIASHGLQALEIQMEDFLLLNYCYGLACVQTGIYSNLLCAIEKFNVVIGRSAEFPAAHYGLGLAYKRLNRFQEALKEFQLAMERRRASQQLHWPQTLSDMEETNPGGLQKLVKQLIAECKHHPKPDAICKFHSDGENSRVEIYFSDPDYKGFIRLRCTCQCCIEFHLSCWKTYKHNVREKHTDKEMLDEQCPTPNCWGFIKVLHVYKPDTEDPVEMISTKEQERVPRERKPVTKMKSTSALHLQKKEEKKRLRKQRRDEEKMKKAQQEAEELSAKSDLHTLAYLANEGRDLRNLNEEGVLLKAKEHDDLLEGKGKQKASKIKKKKEKTKQVLTFDLQFSADKDKELMGLNSFDDESDFANQPGLMGSHPFLPPAQGTPDTSSRSFQPGPITAAPPVGNGLLPLPLKPQPTTDVFQQDLIEFFVNILHGGPIELDSNIVKDILGSVPRETQSRVAATGGIAAFLSSQPQFVVAGGRVHLAKGGPGLLNGKWPLKTQAFPGSTSSRAGSLPWSGGPSSSTLFSQQQSLLGPVPQQPPQGIGPESSNLLPQKQLPNQTTQVASLNPSAREFVPALKRNPSGEVELKSSIPDFIHEKEKISAIDPADDEDDNSGFVVVTHKKNSNFLALKTNKHYKDVSINDMQSISSFQTSNISLSVRNMTSENFLAPKLSILNSKTVSSSLPPAAASVGKISEKTINPSTSTMLPPSSPVPLGKPPDRKVSDASSAVSEEIRASSPASSTSQISQGSTNSQGSSSNPASSSNQKPVCPPQPLKASGLNLPKRSRRRDLREKVVTRSQHSNLPGTTFENSSMSSHEAKLELEDTQSVYTSTSYGYGFDDFHAPASARSKVAPAVAAVNRGGNDPFVDYAASERLNAHLIGTESSLDQDASVWSCSSGYHNSAGNESLSVSPGKESVSGASEGVAERSYFPGMYDYSGSLEHGLDSSLTLDRHLLSTGENSSIPQTSNGDSISQPKESRVLRKLGLSSHSPSPPLLAPRHSLATPNLGSPSNSPSPPLSISGQGLLRREYPKTLGSLSAPFGKKFVLDDLDEIENPQGLGCEPTQDSLYDEDLCTVPSSRSWHASFVSGDATHDLRPLHHYDYNSVKPSHNFNYKTSEKGSASEPEPFPATKSTKPRITIDHRHMWSPLSSDSVQGGLGRQDDGDNSWPSSFSQQIRGKMGHENVAATPDSASESKVRQLVTASVNTDLTGENLKSVEMKFLDMKEERDNLKTQLKMSQATMESEQIHRISVEKKLEQRDSDKKRIQIQLEESERQREALEEERDSLSQALQEVMSKAREAADMKSRLEQEASRSRSYQKQILKLHLQTAMNNLDVRRKEACQHVYKIDSIIHKIRTAGQVEDPSLNAKHSEWEDYVKTCEKAIQELLENGKARTQALDDGVNLEELLPIPVPGLPPLPKPPSEQNLVGHPQPRTAPSGNGRQIQKIIEDLRREHGGSLTSFSFETLARSVAESIMNAAEEKAKNKMGAMPLSHKLPQHAEIGQRGRGPRRGGGGGAAKADGPPEMTCTICHEETGPDSSPALIRRLDCGHQFHEDCIQSWLQVNQTCPNCRSHSLLEEDFPSLR